jgi:predicted nucleotidyltransferase
MSHSDIPWDAPGIQEYKRKIYERSRLVLQCEIGSTVHGIALEDQDDRDEMAIIIEPIECFVCLDHPFGSLSIRTAAEGERSKPGDTDLIIHGLRKFMMLAVSANPSILLPLFVPESALIATTLEGQRLRAMRDAFISNRVYDSFRGYMHQQRERLIADKKKPNRPELVEAYGFDTKYAAHLIRLGYQGIELAETGKFTLPIPQAEYVKRIRRGEIGLDVILGEARQLIARLENLERTNDLGEPHVERVKAFLLEMYTRFGI